jgi:hypothetical protein
VDPSTQTGWKGMDMIYLRHPVELKKPPVCLHSFTAISPDYADRCRRTHHRPDRQITSHISSRRLVTIHDERFTSCLGRVDTPAWSVI